MSTKFRVETELHWWRFDTKEEAKAFQLELNCPSDFIDESKEIDKASYFEYNGIIDWELYEKRNNGTLDKSFTFR